MPRAETFTVGNVGFLEAEAIHSIAIHDDPSGRGAEDIDDAIEILLTLRSIRYPDASCDALCDCCDDPCRCSAATLDQKDRCLGDGKSCDRNR